MRKIKLARQKRKNRYKNTTEPEKTQPANKLQTKIKKKTNNKKKNPDVFQDRFLMDHRKEQRELADYKRGIKKAGKRRLEEDFENDDEVIKQMEKRLKLNKRKSKAMPQSFIDDGLDFVLDICDEKNRKLAVETEKNILGVAESDSETETKSKSKKNSKKVKNKKEDDESEEEPIEDSGDEFSDEMNSDFDEDLDEDEEIEDLDEEEELDNFDEEESFSDGSEDEVKPQVPLKICELKKAERKAKTEKKSKLSISDDEEGFSDDAFGEEDEDIDDFDEEEDDDIPKNKSKAKKNEDGTWEDIYGRKRDAAGNVVSENTGKYIPPAARLTQSGTGAKSETFLRLKRQLKGLLNRLSESNMHSIASQIEQLYMSNSRNDMNEVLSTLISEALVAPILKPDRLIMEHIMLITVLHANVGTEIGAHFLQYLVQKYDEMLKNSPSVENKELDSIISMISHLYNFKIIGSKLMYQILNQLAENFNEKEIELILLILKSVGFSLRKDDPLALKDLIVNLQEKASTAKSNNLRVKFMLETLLAIKNNNMNKLPQYDPTQIERLKKLLKSFLRKGNTISPFEIGLNDLLHANERGRWWIVGSAWTGKEDLKSEPTAKEEKSTFSEKLLELARKQRMNTDSRRNIFCILMSAEDYMDAFEKLHRLGLKGQQSRDIVYVIMDCCLQEKRFNPYYAVLAQKFCDFDRKYQITIQYALWDKLKELQNCTSQQIQNLAQFLVHLFIEKGLPLSVLKVIQLTELDKSNMKLLRRIMIDILTHENIETCLEVFVRITASPKLHHFREGLRLFISHFLIKNMKEGMVSEDQKELLQQRADHVDRLLTTRGSKGMF